MFFPHQIARRSQGIPVANTVKKIGSVDLSVPATHGFRRLYLAANWYGDCTVWQWTCRVSFIQDNHLLGTMNFGAVGSSDKSAPPLELGYNDTTDYTITPPHSVETIPDGASGITAGFTSAAPAQRDEMILQSRDSSSAAAVRLIRMQPIPVFVRCDAVRFEWIYYCRGILGLYETFEGFMGIRSSEVNV